MICSPFTLLIFWVDPLNNTNLKKIIAVYANVKFKPVQYKTSMNFLCINITYTYNNLYLNMLIFIISFSALVARTFLHYAFNK